MDLIQNERNQKYVTLVMRLNIYLSLKLFYNEGEAVMENKGQTSLNNVLHEHLVMKQPIESAQEAAFAAGTLLHYIEANRNNLNKNYLQTYNQAVNKVFKLKDLTQVLLEISTKYAYIFSRFSGKSTDLLLMLIDYCNCNKEDLFYQEYGIMGVLDKNNVLFRKYK